MPILPKYSTRIMARYLGKSVRWVQNMAKREGLGELEGQGLRFSQWEADRLLALCNPDERRGRKKKVRSAVAGPLAPAPSQSDHSA